jgi:hypothetical protein
VCGLRLTTPNQQQQTCVYVTSGSPTLAHLDIEGTVLVVGRSATPTIAHCTIARSRSVGLDFRDHASGVVRCCVVRDNQRAAVRLARCACPAVYGADAGAKANRFVGNAVDGVVCATRRRHDASGDDDDDGGSSSDDGDGCGHDETGVSA